MDKPEALHQQRQRGSALRQHLRKLGDRDYDPGVALLRQFSEFFPRFTGHTVAQNSLEYALLLLHSDDRIYGTDDAGEANRIIRKILSYQDCREGSDTYGNFFWMTHWDRVKDGNAVSFLTTGLVHAYLAFPHKLEDETKEALEGAFPVMLAGLRGHKVRWQYTNIFFLNLGGLVSLSRVLDDPSVHEEAVLDFDTWLQGTADDGFHEFNSPTYTPVTLFGLEAAWVNTPDETWRARLEATMDLLNYHLALNLFPNGFLGGAAARAYQHDILHGNGHASVYAHVKFGTPRLTLDCGSVRSDRVMFANYTLFDYVPPDAVRELAHHKPEYTEIQERSISAKSRRAHVMTPRYSLASQCMPQVGGHSPPAYVLLVRDAPGPRRSVAIVPDESFSHQPCATFQSRQTGSRVVGRLRYEVTEEQRAKFIEDPHYVCEPRALLGPREQIEAVRVGNVDWGGARVHLEPGQPVAVSYGDLFVGLAATPLNPDGSPASGSVALAYGEADELRLCIRLFGGDTVTPEDEPLQALLLMDVRPAAVTDSLEDYATWLSHWQLALRPDDGFYATHPDEPTLGYPYTEQAPDPIGDALHRSPEMLLRPGDLVRLVSGEQIPPFAWPTSR